MAINNTPIVRQDVYDLEENMLQLAKTYFPNADGTDTNISTLRPTIFGYISDVVASTAEASVFHRNALFDELFLNTASMDSSIYNFCKLYDYQVATATPGKVSISLAIKERDLFSYSILEQSTGGAKRSLKLDKLTKFMFGSYEFHLPHPIKIVATKFGDSAGDGTLFTGGFWSYDIRYLLEEETLPGFKMEVPFIKSIKTSIGEDSWLVFNMTAIQVSMIESEYEIFSTDVAAYLSFLTEFQGDLAGFDVQYGSTNRDTGKWEIRPLTPVFNASTPPTGVNSEYFYYSCPTEKSIQIFFGFLPDWRPSFGSKIYLRVCTTLGQEGNFTYSNQGEINVQLVTPAKTSNDPNVYANLERIQVLARNLTDSAGGRNRPTMKEIKKE
jgi:hypothetical protein